MIKVVGIGNPVMDFLIHTKRIPVTNGVSELEGGQTGGQVSCLAIIGGLKA